MVNMKLRLILAGRIDDDNYQKTFECTEFLKNDRPLEYEFNILAMFPVQWEAHLDKIRERFGIERLSSAATCVVYSEDGEHLWCGNDFVDHICGITNFKLFDYPDDSEDPAAYKNQAKIRYNQFLRQTGHAFCYLWIAIDGQRASEKVVVELFTDLCPRTCDNFRHLCIGDMGEVKDTTSGDVIKLHYKDTPFFRIVKDGWIQAGDLVNGKGNGGYSVYGAVFPDECFSIGHDGEGILGMANNGKNTNASQFYITVGRNSWMDKQYVAFGRVIEGISVIRQIHNLKTRPNQRPQVDVVIEDCGEIDLTKF
eukprot:NODE_579_length_1284_cov_17.198381_g417_i0.p1 GENE.NODE_579_length_1284_cov_17.198381_g417_i0~~NODE_579_length_1284_cov_17.198381_g417_i0.p1  ORF type:complete len:310 (+),score=100.22 NODE_579_length_1284_cov_17.198381_g417_i0:89-1018(+)